MSLLEGSVDELAFVTILFEIVVELLGVIGLGGILTK